MKGEGRSSLPKDKTILCLCQMGMRSGRAAAILSFEGYKAVNIVGGLGGLQEVMNVMKKNTQE